MKYYRKEPVMAVQWRGENRAEVRQFICKVSGNCSLANSADGSLRISYWDAKDKSHLANIPKFGWVVIEGKTLQLYKNETFRKTFKPADDNDPVWNSTQEVIDKFEKSFEDMAHLKMVVDNIGAPAIPIRRDFVDAFNMAAHTANISNGAKPLADFLQRDCVSRKEAKETFDSVLDEMKELHAKKNKDYKGSFHDLFKEYGMPYALGHLEEKLNRVKAITANGGSAVKNEHIEDSLMDLGCYTVMLYVELKNSGDEED